MTKLYYIKFGYYDKHCSFGLYNENVVVVVITGILEVTDFLLEKLRGMFQKVSVF